MTLSHWRLVPAAHRRWILTNAVVISAVSNLLINSAIAWITSYGKHHIPLWSIPLLGGPNLITDTIGTLYLLPFTTCLVVSYAVRKSQGRGQLTILKTHQKGPGWLSNLPASIPRRASRLSGLVLLFSAPVAIVILLTGFGGGISRYDFVVFKALLGLVLGLAVTTFIALAAMGDEYADADDGTQAVRHREIAGQPQS
jgi:hypothetical protein